MPAFLVGYDVQPGRDYAEVVDVLEAVGGVRMLDGLWLWDIPEGADTIRYAMCTLFEPSDAIVVLELAAHPRWATVNVNEAATSWLLAN